MLVEQQIREIALNLSVKSYVDFEQPRNASGYSTGNYHNDTPSGDEILKRAHRFAHFIREGEIIPAPTLQGEEK